MEDDFEYKSLVISGRPTMARNLNKAEIIILSVLYQI